MKSFSTFSFDSYAFDYETLTAKFTYRFDEEFFTETVHFFTPVRAVKTDLNEAVIDELLSHIHIAMGISYYKLSPTAKIQVPEWRTAEMLNFWHMFYLQGLGEFMVVNGLHPQNVARFITPHPLSLLPFKTLTTTSRNGSLALLFFGGGKDSLVSVELLKQRKHPFILRSMGDSPLHALAASKVNAPRIIQTRQLDPKLFEMNKSGEWYNGHVPITGILSFISLLTAYLYGFDEMVLSNEKSANVGNKMLDGIEINHQRSKSEEFETAFQEYIKKHLNFQPRYYSILRQRDELRIVEEFCKYPQYFHHFSSCNRNFHLTGSKLTGRQLRCGECPKCAFVYTMMRAFLPAETVDEIFGKKLFADEALLPLFRELLGIEGCKPFECVGTEEEMREALKLMTECGFKEGEERVAQLLDLFSMT
ncbi:MAG: hypothetical protein LBG52_08810 [Candidatus Peribacteria bacterium]|jgi:hypothetical protein|nr:hypothetical protein [Candidatus Peribacteria bacterium]